MHIVQFHPFNSQQLIKKNLYHFCIFTTYRIMSISSASALQNGNLSWVFHQYVRFHMSSCQTTLFLWFACSVTTKVSDRYIRCHFLIHALRFSCISISVWSFDKIPNKEEEEIQCDWTKSIYLYLCLTLDEFSTTKKKTSVSCQRENMERMKRNIRFVELVWIKSWNFQNFVNFVQWIY